MADLAASAAFDAAAFVDAVAPACGFVLTEERRAGTIANIERTFAFARMLDDVSGLADTEPATVFAPRQS